MINWTTVEDAIHDWALNYSGLNPSTEAGKAIWAEQSIPQPDPTYLTLKILSGPVKVGAQDDLRYVKDVTITFDADFVSGNNIDLKIDGVSMTTVPWNADHATTMLDLIAQIQADFRQIGDVTEDSRVVRIAARIDTQTLVVSNVAVTGGSTQASATVSAVEKYNVAGPRTFVLGVQTYGASSLNFITNLLNSLDNPIVIALFDAAGIAVNNSPSVLDVTDLRNTVFEKRHSLDIGFNIASNVEIDLDIIEKATIDGTLDSRTVQIEVNQ